MTSPGKQNRRRVALIFFVAVNLAICANSALAAQNAPAAQPSAPAGSSDPVFDAQKAAFDALSEADRRAIQDALVWTGDYNGVVDGAFGKRTRDSILAYQANIKAPTTGIVDAAEVARLVATAQKAKEAVKFQIIADEKTGIRIGAPLRILDKRVVTGGGSRLAKADGSITLDLASLSGADANLAALYGRLTADAPGKKVAFKLSRPDFIVVSTEGGGRKTYARFAKAPANGSDPNVVRGFTLSYPAQSSDFDRIALAIADSFEPFPAGASRPTVTSTPPSSGASVGLAASGLIVASGEALSAIGSSECPHPSVDGKPGKYLHEDKQSGLSLIGASVMTDAAVAAPALAPLSDDLIALSYDETGGKPILDVTAVTLLAQTAGDQQPLLLAALGASAVGGPVFDRKGALVALIARGAPAPKLVAGVSPLSPHPAIVEADIERFLGGVNVATGNSGGVAAVSAGRIAADKRALVVSISCN
jgi:peptidoglycan hydrolase-like protein with peptidoglycan-binding domain